MFGNRLRDLRLENELTQKELGRILGVSTSAIGMYEQGRRDPDTEMLSKCAGLFNVTTDYLLGHTSDRRPTNNSFSTSAEKTASSRDAVEQNIFNMLNAMTPEQRSQAMNILRAAFPEAASEGAAALQEFDRRQATKELP